jgi:hypothetical protein
MKKLTRKLTSIMSFSREEFQQQLQMIIKQWSETPNPSIQRHWRFHVYHAEDFRLLFLVRECSGGLMFQIIKVDQEGCYQDSWLYDSGDVFREYRFEHNGDEHVIKLVDCRALVGQEPELPAGPVHYIKLPNGSYLALRYRDNAILLGTSLDGSEVETLICTVGEHEVTLYGNYSPADALYGLVFDSDVPPAYSHSRND